MDPDLIRGMFEYYDQRAIEYDELYTHGTAPKSQLDPGLFIEEVSILSAHVAEHCRGRVLDIPSGTGFWLQFYYPHCTQVTLVDQSENMLIESRKKSVALGGSEKISLIRANILEWHFTEGEFDSALVGFFLDHLNDDQIRFFFGTLKSALKPGASVLFMDSIYSAQRRHLRKEGVQIRNLQDGRTYGIYKRYLDRGEFGKIGMENGIEFTIVHEGEVYIAAIGRFRD